MIRLLLADDHAIMRDGLRLLLESSGEISIVAEACSGSEAVRMAFQHEPDVVIMDISMPDLNGIEATRRILEKSPKTQIVILSMHSTPEDIFRALQAGAKGYLLKESAGKELIEAVKAVKQGIRYLSRKVDDILIDSYLHERIDQDSKSPLSRLSSREREIMQLVAEGKTSHQIGELLFISSKTVDTYRSRLMQKLGIKDLAGLIKFAVNQGLTSGDH
jgi:two-component system, NarL family, response regulator NreC